MLVQVSIRNFALIDDLQLDFSQGFNVFTGETGAGKSLLLDGLGCVLGERFDSSFVRDATKNCQIRATFSVSDDFNDIPEIMEYLEEGDDLLVVSREVTPEGRSRSKINGHLVNLSTLKELGNKLVDIHGQYDHQNIFDASEHLGIIDRYARSSAKEGVFDELMSEYAELYKKYFLIEKRKKELAEAKDGKERRIDLLEYQIKEIEEISPEENEEDALKEEKVKLAHSEKLNEITGNIIDALDGSEISASSQISRVFKEFRSWSQIDGAADKKLERIESLQLDFEELIAEVREYREDLKFDDDRLREIEERLSGIETLKRKYGSSITEVLNFLNTAKEEYDQLINSDVYEKDLAKEWEQVEPHLKQKAAELSKIRKAAIKQISSFVEKELKELGIKYAQFQCHVEKAGFGPLGSDSIEFMFCPNAGEKMQPLIKIASGGEASRVMLAVKRALSRADLVPTLIFDEIDANIGGRLGHVVGDKVKAIAKEKQVLLITHLPQIASFAKMHFRVSKSVVRGRTLVSYKPLNTEERVQELSQMLSGEQGTKISKAHAREMLNSAKS